MGSDALRDLLKGEGIPAINYNGRLGEPSPVNLLPEWMNRVQAGINDPSVRLYITLDGLEGATSDMSVAQQAVAKFQKSVRYGKTLSEGPRAGQRVVVHERQGHLGRGAGNAADQHRGMADLPWRQVTVTHYYKADMFEAPPGRLFQIRQAARGNAQIWLQADRPFVDENRIEVLIPAVQYLCLPFAIRGLYLRLAPAEEAARLTELHGVTVKPELEVYLLSREHDWFVVSAKPAWAESALSYSEPTVFFNPDYGPDVVVSVGTLT